MLDKDDLKVKTREALSRLCDEIINLSISDENYEDAADIRDARNALSDALAKAIDNMLPF